MKKIINTLHSGLSFESFSALVSRLFPSLDISCICMQDDCCCAEEEACCCCACCCC